jgi:hypothetical protein
MKAIMNILLSFNLRKLYSDCSNSNTSLYFCTAQFDSPIASEDTSEMSSWNLSCLVLVLHNWPSFWILRIKPWFLHYRPSSAVPAPTSSMMECEVIGFDGEDRSLKSALIHPAPPLLLVLPQTPNGVDCWLTTEWLFGKLRRASIVLWYPSCHVVNLSYRNRETEVCQSHC